MANITADFMEDYLWDDMYGGFFRSTQTNWNLPETAKNTSKYTLDNSWAAIALIKLYNITKSNIDEFTSRAIRLYLLIPFTHSIPNNNTKQG